MRGIHDATVDTASIEPGAADVVESREVWPGIRFDFDDAGRTVGIFDDASTRLAAGAALATWDVA